MANLPSQHPNLSLHMVDRTLTPLITSSRTQDQLQSLSSVSQTALLAHEAAFRLGLGAPQRVMVEHGPNGPVLLHSYVSRAASSMAQETPSPRVVQIDGEAGERAGGGSSAAFAPGYVESDEDAVAPMLVGTVIAPSADSALEARRAAARLERVGREVQTRWAEMQQQDQSTANRS
ncbi:hypothetical protein JX266_003705 [Neoarthrinium moseri]|nr:hypothetical protein JX266_003705 [Neoarthrinium moseri]